MPLPTIAFRNQGRFDKFLELRNKANAAVAATTSEAPLAFPVRSFRAFRAIVQHDAFTGFVSGTAQWTFSLQASATAGGSYTTIGSAVTLTGSSSVIEIPTSGAEILRLVPNAEFLRVTATLTGAAGSIQYTCYLEELY